MSSSFCFSFSISSSQRTIKNGGGGDPNGVALVYLRYAIMLRVRRTETSGTSTICRKNGKRSSYSTLPLGRLVVVVLRVLSVRTTCGDRITRLSYIIPIRRERTTAVRVPAEMYFELPFHGSRWSWYELLKHFETATNLLRILPPFKICRPTRPRAPGPRCFMRSYWTLTFETRSRTVRIV